MAITTYAELQTTVKTWLRRSDLDSDIPDLITLGETRIMRDVRSRDMETTFSDTIANGTISLPTSYIELKFAYVNSSPTVLLKKADPGFIYLKYPTRSANGEPRYIGRDGSNFIFGPYPDSNYTIAGTYYKNVGPVSSSAHSLFTNNPDLYLFAALCEAEPLLHNDKRVMLWETKYNKIKDDVTLLDDRELMGGGPLQMRPA